MKKLIILTSILLSGCSVLHTVDYEIKREIAGFNEDWIRTFNSKQGDQK